MNRVHIINRELSWIRAGPSEGFGPVDSAARRVPRARQRFVRADAIPGAARDRLQKENTVTALAANGLPIN